MRVQERADRQPRRVARFCVEALEQRDRLVGGERVLEQAGVVLAESVRVGPDPLREAVVVEQIGIQVLLDVVLDRRPVVVDRQQVPVAVLGVEIRVRDVPLALVVRPIAAGPEPVAQRRHRYPAPARTCRRRRRSWRSRRSASPRAATGTGRSAATCGSARTPPTSDSDGGTTRRSAAAAPRRADAPAGTRRARRTRTAAGSAADRS